MNVCTLEATVDGIRSVHICAIAEGDVVGYGKVDERYEAIVLTDLFVQPDHRRMGIGRAIVETAEGVAGNLGGLLCVYFVPDGASARMFRSLGYTVTDVKVWPDWGEQPWCEYVWAHAPGEWSP